MQFWKSLIGQTKMNLDTRLKDHNLNSKNQETDVTEHILDNPNHYIDFNNIIVLSTESLAQIIN